MSFKKEHPGYWKNKTLDSTHKNNISKALSGRKLKFRHRKNIKKGVRSFWKKFRRKTYDLLGR